MLAANVSEIDLYDAMDHMVNRWGTNITWNRKPEKVGRRFRFTLTVRDSRGKFAKMNPINGRHVHALCWHGHGEFFKCLFAENPNAVIISNRQTWTKTDAESGFTDWQEGSMMYPYKASEACNCNSY